MVFLRNIHWNAEYTNGGTFLPSGYMTVINLSCNNILTVDFLEYCLAVLSEYGCNTIRHPC